MVTYTTTDLINSIRRTAHVPQGNNTFNPADFLAIADMEMRTGVAPMIASCRENYWLTTQEQTINANVNEYPLPSLAIGSAIVDVMINSNSNMIHLSRIEVSDIYSTQYSTRPAYCYYIQDSKVKLLPNVIPGILTMWYYRIPSQLVLTSACAQITNIVGADCTVNAVPSTFSTSQQMDIVSQNPGFNVLLKDTAPVTIAGSDITFPSLPTDIAVGDYICLSGQSCVVQSPLEWVEVLVQRAVVKIYEIQGYERKHDLAMKVLMAMEKNAMSVVSPRTIESSKVISGGGSLLTPQTIGWKLPVRG